MYHIFNCCTFNICLCENVFPISKLLFQSVVCLSFEINEFKYYAMHTQQHNTKCMYKIGSIILCAVKFSVYIHTCSNNLSSAHIAACFQSIFDSNGNTQEFDSSTGIQPACKASRNLHEQIENQTIF